MQPSIGEIGSNLNLVGIETPGRSTERVVLLENQLFSQMLAVSVN